jgi:apolipoprotein N-acyltransferase
MILFHWFLLITSALCYGLSLVASAHLWWLAFLFAIPLFYVTAQERVTIAQGAVWGLLAMGVQLLGVFIGVDTGFAAKGSFAPRLAPFFLALLYCTIYPILWFWLTQKLKDWLGLSSPGHTIILWLVSLWFFIFFLDRGILWVCGRWEGYFLLHPIIALTRCPALLSLLPYLGKNLLSFLLYLVSATIAYFLIKRDWRSALYVCFSLLPWLVSIAVPRPYHRPAWLDKIVAVPLKVTADHDRHRQAQQLETFFNKIIKQKPKVELIIMPESSFYFEYLSTSPELYRKWSSEHLGRPLHFIIGSFRGDAADNHYNTIHWIYNGQLQGFADKRHVMPLIEHLPAVLNLGFMQELFFKGYNAITPSAEDRPRLKLLKEVSFIPYICSELFFNEYPDDRYTDGVILSTSNDAWVKGSYIGELMHLAALFKALQWQRPILYVSFSYAAYFDIYGNQYPVDISRDVLHNVKK